MDVEPRPEPAQPEPGLLVGRSVDLPALEALARDEGLRSVVNTNTEGEPGELLSPNFEATWAHALALEHARASLDPGHPTDEIVDELLEALDRLPRPVLVHSRGGTRARTLAIVHLALRHDWRPEEAVERAHERGLAAPPERWRRFLEREIVRVRAERRSPTHT